MRAQQWIDVVMQYLPLTLCVRWLVMVMSAVGALSMSGCMTYGVVDAARGQEEARRPLAKDIHLLSASTDGAAIQVCFMVRSGTNESVYTAIAPDPDGPSRSGSLYGTYDVRPLKNGCRQHGQELDLLAEFPKNNARGIYHDGYYFLYFSGNRTALRIEISEADQFKTRVNARPAYYLTVPFTLVADIVVTPLWLLWMASCGSCT